MDKETQIIRAALKLLIEHGTQATPMSAIARAAHTGMGTIYHYFATKEALINAIYVFVKQEQLRAVAAPPVEASVKRRFDHYYLGLITYLIAQPDYFRFMNQYDSSPILTAETHAEGFRVFGPVVELLTAGQEQGIVKDVDLNQLLAFLYSGILGFVRWSVQGEKPTSQAVLQNQLRLAWDAIKQ